MLQTEDGDLGNEREPSAAFVRSEPGLASPFALYGAVENGPLGIPLRN
jgi:hypothetical protein